MKFIPLTQGLFAWVDDADFERVSMHKWYPVKNKTTVYAYSRLDKGKRGKQVPMHVFIMGTKVDHKDHDGLNNQRCNLRPATQGQNRCNSTKTTSKTSSKFKGVCWHKKAQRWMASIKLHSKPIYIGLFMVEYDAARAYDAKARELFGEFANTNFKEVL
jgi:hypothetical protein